MAVANGSNTQIKIALEKTEGEVRDSGNFATLPFKAGESLTTSYQTYESEMASKTRGVTDVIKGSYTVGGGIPTELSLDNMCLFGYAALGGIEESDNVKTFKRASKLPTFSIEKSFTDIGENYVFKGCKVNDFSIQTQSDGIVQCSSTINGLTFDRKKDTSFFESLTEKTLSKSIFSDNNVEIKIGEVTTCANSFNIQINNDLQPFKCIGFDHAKTQSEGRGSVTGDVSITFENGTIYEKWKSGATEKMEITYKMDDDNYIKIILPKVKWGGDGISKVDAFNALFVNISFTALVDDTENTDIKIEVKSQGESFKTMLGIE